MTTTGYALRVLSRILLNAVYFILPRARFQDFAVPYVRLCYFVTKRLGIKLERDGV